MQYVMHAGIGLRVMRKRGRGTPGTDITSPEDSKHDLFVALTYIVTPSLSGCPSSQTALDTSSQIETCVAWHRWPPLFYCESSSERRTLPWLPAGCGTVTAERQPRYLSLSKLVAESDSTAWNRPCLQGHQDSLKPCDSGQRPRA